MNRIPGLTPWEKAGNVNLHHVITKRFLIIVSVVLAGACVLFLLYDAPAKLVPRQVKLVIRGADGQRFTGTYVSDGITNTLSTAVPTTIRLWAREVTYEFQPEDEREEFRVALEVEKLQRSSFASHQGKSVRGGWRYWSTGESVW